MLISNVLTQPRKAPKHLVLLDLQSQDGLTSLLLKFVLGRVHGSSFHGIRIIFYLRWFGFFCFY